MMARIEILGRPVQVEWSEGAARALAALARPLSVEMELYFSCLIRKKVRFGTEAHSRCFVPVNPQLEVAFRPVMSKSCRVDRERDAPPLEDFPMANPAAFVPRWLKIGHRGGRWEGEFGF